MPKAKWGSVKATDIDNAETGNAAYAGEMPPRGVYRFVLKFAKEAQSQAGNPKLQMLWLLDGSWREGHSQFDGCPLWDNMPVMDNTLFRVKAYCAAIGVTSAEFLDQTVTDEEKQITKIGKVAFNNPKKPIVVYANVQLDTSGDSPQLKLNGTGYLPKKDGDAPVAEGDQTSDDPWAADVASNEAAKASGKVKKGKKKGAAAGEALDSEPPF